MPENGCEVVVVGASAGGVEALTRFVRALPLTPLTDGDGDTRGAIVFMETITA